MRSAQVAVYGADGEATFGESVGDFLSGALGASEDHGGTAASGLQHPADQLDLVQGVGAVDVLRGGVVDGRGVRRFGPNVGRLVHERAGQRDDRVRHGRREQHRLPLVGDLTQDPFDVGQKAQVEHLVGLVEDQHRQAAQLQMALLGQVKQPAGSAHHHVRAGAQRLDLRLVGAAAVDGHHRHPSAVVGAQIFGGGGEVAGHLQAQFAGGHDDQPPGYAGKRPIVAAGGDALQHRHPERERFAHSGAGLPDQVVAGECQRQRQLLDGKRMLNALFAQCLHYFVADTDFSKGHFGCGLGSCDEWGHA